MLSIWHSACAILLNAVLIFRVPFPFGVWGRMFNSIESLPNHCLSSTLVLPLNVLLFSALSNGCAGVDCGHGSCSCLVTRGYRCRCMFGYTGYNCQTGEN